MRKNIVTVLSVLLLGGVALSFQDAALKQSMKRGEEVYNTNCLNCHMQNGEGLEGSFPPLAKADYIAKDKTGTQVIKIVLNGLEEEITVNGKKYNVLMPAQNYLTDQQISDVLNYVRNSWGNKGKIITEAQVKAERK